MNAKITNIKRFAVHDGNGIRTTVFFKGCPLKCVWCHNPETISSKPQLAFYAHKCIICKKCVQFCNCHTFNDGIHKIDRHNCTFCGKCEKACPCEALEIIGKEMTVDEVFNIAVKDKSFYDGSGGGVTLSGGECLLQADFCAELLKKLKSENINTAVDTCGFAAPEAFDKVIPYTDIFLYDIKAIDDSVHIKCTGQSNKIIIDNLKYIDGLGKKTEIRIPYVPGYNTEEKDKILLFLSTLKNISAVKILPYHNYAGSKYDAISAENTLPKNIPSQEEISSFQNAADKLVMCDIQSKTSI